MFLIDIRWALDSSSIVETESIALITHEDSLPWDVQKEEGDVVTFRELSLKGPSTREKSGYPVKLRGKLYSKGQGE